MYDGNDDNSIVLSFDKFVFCGFFLYLKIYIDLFSVQAISALETSFHYNFTTFTFHI